MRILHDFRYERPSSLEEALALLEEHGAEARPLAGGTDVVVGMKHRSMLQLVGEAGTDRSRFPAAGRVPPIDRPGVLISLADLTDLARITVAEDLVTVGPRATMTQIVATQGMPAALAALTDAAAIMGSPQIRNRATVGGNLVNARPAADTAVAAIALGARITLASAGGSRTVEADGFITAPGETVRRPDELVTAMELPFGPGQGSAYVRQGTRRQLEIALVGAASWVEIDPGSGDVAAARICLGAVGPTPICAPGAARSLEGGPPTAERIGRAAEIAEGEARPIDDYRGSAAYRREVVGVLVRRTLAAALERAGRQAGR